MIAVCSFCSSPLVAGVALCRRCGRSTFDALAGNKVGASQFADLAKVETKPLDRLRLGDPWDQIWGPPEDPGFACEDITLLAGFPGFGKTTMLLAFAIRFAEITGRPSYYVCSEQSSDALRRTIDRCGFKLLEGQIKVLISKENGAHVDKSVFQAAPPAAIMLDSITDFCRQNDYTGQVSLCHDYRDHARMFRCPTFLIIQMNKQGDAVGMEKLQHDVDAVCELENVHEARRINQLIRDGYNFDVDGDPRIICMHKNRSGPTSKDFPLIMTPTGLKPMDKIDDRKARRGVVKTGNPVADMINERANLVLEMVEAKEAIKDLKETIADLDMRIDRESAKILQRAMREPAPVPAKRAKPPAPARGKTSARPARPPVKPTAKPKKAGARAKTKTTRKAAKRA